MEFLFTNTCIVGTGAAGYNAASRLWDYGQKDILMITENILAGTSRNTGSDKQTYYKLTLSGGVPDSVREMAETLFNGEGVDGDVALCEAALSAPSFLRLADLGVPFPVNRYGEYVGYKTDHDPRNRATSVGPYTSKKMTEVLEEDVQRKGIKIRNGLQVIRLLVKDGRILGLIALNLHATEKKERYIGVCCQNIILATGGPAGMYSNSVYPKSQHGASGLAFEAGAKGKNLTEWQFGLASVRPRWNVSGTYMQVLPRMISAETDGTDEREFLCDYFTSDSDLLTDLFLKGYQWPFDIRKVENGSSIIDILVFLELQKGRRVFLDYTKDPLGDRFSLNKLSEEAYDYLNKANALCETPIKRLQVMNQPAIDFYLDKGVDLSREKLEISVCVQHNNGGLDIDCWWQTNIEGLFACGEAAGSHGVYRPGGSALNAGQVGSTRCALYIANARKDSFADNDAFEAAIRKEMEDIEKIENDCRSDSSNVRSITEKAMKEMSFNAGIIRNQKTIEKAIIKTDELLKDFERIVTYREDYELSMLFKLRDTLISQKVYLEAMYDYARSFGLSRGSSLYTNDLGTKAGSQLSDGMKYLLDDGSRSNFTQIISYDGDKCTVTWRKVRPIPDDEDFFENVWRDYRRNKNIY